MPLKKPFVKAALNRSATLFAWLGKREQHLEDLLRRRSHSDMEDLWKELVLAHALDLFHDEGMEGLAWPTAASQAIATLAMLLKVSSASSERTLELKAFRLTFCPVTRSSKPGEIPVVLQDPVKELRVLTMADVQRDLTEWSLENVLGVSRLLRQHGVKPLPALGLASGAFIALSALGRLTRTPALVEEREVRSVLTWEDWDQGLGPTGEWLKKDAPSEKGFAA